MMAKAHITVGLAAAFTVVQPHTLTETLPVITGASIGCLICDLDCENSREKTESSHWRIVMAVVAVAALVEDHLMDASMWKSVGQNGPYLWFFGLAGFATACIFASISSHRGFSHSLLALALETVCLWMIFPQTALPFATAFVSHVMLDLMNKRSVRLLYPAKRGFCFGWFYADRLANKVFTASGSIWLAAAVMIALRQYMQML